MMRHMDLFSGYGGFALAFQRHSFRTVSFAEIEPFACRVLAHHWPAVPNLGSVTEIDGTTVRERFGHIDVVTFGSPCQDLSVAGKRAGLVGERSGLFHEAVRIIRDVRPTFAIWENVPGAFSSNRGFDFGTVLDSLADIGALDIAWRVLDAQFCGVPQRRRRIFVVADFRGERAGEILSLAEGVRGDSAPRREKGQDVAPCLRSGAVGGRSHGKVNGTDQQPMVVANSLGANAGRQQIEQTYVPDVSSPLTEGYAKSAFNDGKRGVIPNVVTAPLTAKMAKGTGGPSGDECQNLVTHSPRAEGFDASEDGTGRGTPLVPAFLHCNKGRPDGRQSKHTEMVTVEHIVPTLPTDGHVQSAMVVNLRGREGGAMPEVDRGGQVSLRASSGGSSKSYVLPNTAPCLTQNYGKQPDNSDTSAGPCVIVEQNTQCSTPPLPSLRAHETPNYGVLAFNTKESGRDAGPVAPPLRAESGDPHMGGRTAVAFHENQRAETTLNDTAGSLKTGGGKPGQGYPAVQGAFGVSRLTPLECERLMGLPDGWTAIPGAADGPRYRCLGNGVVVPVVEQIAERMANVNGTRE